MADTQLIKDRIDIVQLIGEYIQLKKAGANWKAPCPFHHEKSPSFMVHPEKQIWHCFGCGKGGDIFVFIQEMEGLEFVGALELLAKRAGVEIAAFKNDGSASQRTRLMEINKVAANFYHRVLVELAAAKPARDYLTGRGVEQQTIIDWQIGFIPDQWDLLTKYLVKKGYTYDDLLTVGLTIKRDGADVKSGRGFYDRFRGRVMFPICDVHGNVIGFTGRVLVETEHSGGKYVNTPQSPLYDKSRALYGIHKAKTAIKAKDQAVLVEGQMDVVACHQAGMANVIAASGTALTVEQIKLLKRYTTNLAMAFDADQAGINAGKRGIGVAVEEGMNCQVIQIPTGFAKDADECLKKDKNVWFKAVDTAKDIMDWYFSITLNGFDRTNPQAKQKVADILLVEINRIPHAVERDEWLKRLSEAVDIDINLLRQELKKIPAPKKSGAADTERTAKTASITIPTSQLALFGQEVWSLVIKFPAIYSVARENLKKEYFEEEALVSLYETAESLYNKDNQFDLEAIRHYFHKEGLENVVDVLLLRPYKNFTDINAQEAKQEVISLANRLKDEWRKKRGKELERAISQAEKAGDKIQLEALVREMQIL
ncbi:MAG: DNA primase [Candidatus Magasanikbacteria bacterium RIFCSPLOWO2_02_FULL_44_11]|uniref:DNA primase n=1 Tax=Candidatus Magasanikbacteria bacterium RIFCSPLOWO2_02_FULL_44_11 TaxID=1798689 RepID=A0A1F6NBQ9_9BACT|nr:MAG: DNA primase [Candidatus Magasanikbacteria bacterium RIFCSPLOWO2_02_FULL_44_11]